MTMTTTEAGDGTVSLRDVTASMERLRAEADGLVSRVESALAGVADTVASARTLQLRGGKLGLEAAVCVRIDGTIQADIGNLDVPTE